jgi:hypothetical protein
MNNNNFSTQVDLKKYTLTEAQLDNLLCEFFGKILQETSGNEAGVYDVEFSHSSLDTRELATQCNAALVPFHRGLPPTSKNTNNTKK